MTKAPETAAGAKELYREGARLYDIGEYDQAIDHFQRAYLITGAPTLLLNIGQAQRLSGACALSAASYRRYLENVPATPHRAEVEQRVREMDECAVAKEKQPKRAREPLPADSDVETPVTRPAPRAFAVPSSSSWRTIGWIGLGLGAAGAALGSIGLGLTLDAQADLDRVCTSNGACPRSAEARLDAYERWRLIAATGAAVTVVGAAIAVVGFALSSEKSSSPKHRQEREAGVVTGVVIAPWLGLSQAGLGGTFF